MATAPTLAQAIRAKYPGAYDDLSDSSLEAQVKAKYPGAYDDFPATAASGSNAATIAAPDTSVSHLAYVGLKQTASDLFHGFANLIGSARPTPDHPDPIDALIAHQVIDPAHDQVTKAREAFQQGRYSEAAGHAMAAAIPVIGPMAASVGEQIPETQTGTPEHRAQAAGHILATVAQGALPDAMDAAGDALPAVKAAMDARAAAKPVAGAGRFSVDLLKAIPPSPKAPYSPLDVARGMPYLSAEHASAPITTVETLRDGADSGITQIEDKMTSYANAFPGATIDTHPLDAARAVLATGARASDMAIGMKELDDLGLDQPITLGQADDIRHRLNAENKATLAKNTYDAATARETDPAFAAREAAANSIREGFYDKLEQLGVPGVADLRRDEGSLIKIRNAAQNQVYKGAQSVPKTGASPLTAKLIRGGASGAGAALGATVGGPAAPITAAAGATIGNDLATRFLPPNLTRDALVERAFTNLQAAAPTYPAVPPPSPVRGLLPPAPTPLGGIPARLESQMSVSHAASRVVRDPVTGRFKRIFTSEAQP
jgi:hypothetical protein